MVSELKVASVTRIDKAWIRLGWMSFGLTRSFCNNNRRVVFCMTMDENILSRQFPL